MSKSLRTILNHLITWAPYAPGQDDETLYGEVPDDFTPRIVWNDGDGVMVKFGNTPHYRTYSESAAKALPGVRDER